MNPARIASRLVSLAVVTIATRDALGQGDMQRARAAAQDDTQRTAAAGERAAAAESLFDTARQQLDQQRYDEACANLEESQRLDPAVGTQLYLGLCYEKAGKLASAWSAYKSAQSAASQAKQRDRERIAGERAQALESRLAHLTVRLVHHPNDTFTVKRDGVVLGAASVGQAMPVDAGTHFVEVTVRGRAPWSKTIEVEQGKSVEIELDTSTLKATPASVSAQPLAHVPRPPLHSNTPHRRRHSTQRWAAITAGGVGLVGLGVGAGFAWRAASKSSDAEQFRRPGTNIYDGAGYDLNQDALDANRVSLVASVAGGAALAAGIVLYFTAPATDAGVSRPPSAMLGIDGRGISLLGSWR